MGYTLWWTNIAMERSIIFHGKIHYFYGHFQLLFVCSPEGTQMLLKVTHWGCTNPKTVLCPKNLDFNQPKKEHMILDYVATSLNDQNQEQGSLFGFIFQAWMDMYSSGENCFFFNRRWIRLRLGKMRNRTNQENMGSAKTESWEASLQERSG